MDRPGRGAALFGIAGAGWLIAGGAVLTLLGLLHIMDLVATLHVSGAI